MNSAEQEVVVHIPLTELHPFPDHPFKVRDDEAMQETAASIKEYGVLVPALARPREDGGYELIAGHRRKHGCELAGLDTMPVIVRNIDQDTATIIMVDSNLQRESILPSERAQAYKMKLEAIKRRAGRPSKDSAENSPKISANFRSDDEIGSDAGVSGDTIRNYISLTQLVPELQQIQIHRSVGNDGKDKKDFRNHCCTKRYDTRKRGARNDRGYPSRYGFSRSPRTGVVETNLSRRERTGLGYLSHLYGKPCGYDEGHSRKE